MLIPTAITPLVSANLRSFGPYSNGSRTASTSGTLSTVYSTPTPIISYLIISTDGQCSGLQTCLGSPFGQSCSRWGWCGNSTAHSGEGCQPAFGLCDQTTVTTMTTQIVTETLTTRTVLSVPTGESSSPASTSAPAFAVPYTMYLGTGGVDAASGGWPVQDNWLDFNSLFRTNINTLSTSCAQWNVPNNSDVEVQEVKAAIQNIALSSGVDERFVLAIVLQESNGCVRAPTTVYSVTNPGLMQSYNGTHSCNTGSATVAGVVQNPCPALEIEGMLADGTIGTGQGSTNLVQALVTAGCQDVSKYYKAARIYNSGSIAGSGLLQDVIATHCYSSDIANRLMGWNGSGRCMLPM